MTNDYYLVFQERSGNHGKTFKEVVQKQARHDFKYFLQSSPNAIKVTINSKEGKETKVATILNKENETLVKRYFLCDIADQISIGDFLYWGDSIWLMFRKERDTIEAYDKFEGIECRHKIQWVDSYGVLQNTPCYLVAQKDDQIKSNFRTWNNMITPQPNKYLEIITCRNNIQLGQKFLIDETAWYVVESDYISIKNILYLSLTEDKKDIYVDDIADNIANIVDLNKFEMRIKDKEISLDIDKEYKIAGEVYLNGNKYSDKIIIEVIEGADLVTINDNFTLTALSEGRVVLRICMEENNEIYQEMIINIVKNAPQNISYQLIGDESIKWGRTKVIQAVKVVDGVSAAIAASFKVVDKEELLSSYEINSSSVTITADTKNKVGNFTIICTFEDGSTVEKTIRVTSLWM